MPTGAHDTAGGEETEDRVSGKGASSAVRKSVRPSLPMFLSSSGNVEVSF